MSINVSTKINVSLSNHVLISFFSYRCPSLKLWVFQTSIRCKLWSKSWWYFRSISRWGQDKSRKLSSPIRQNHRLTYYSGTFSDVLCRSKSVLKEIADHILHQKFVSKWDYEENNHLSELGKNLLNTVPNTLRQFRKWVNQMTKHIKKVVFVKT